jgi:hypothetical protein
MSDSEAQRRRRWISLGEVIAIAALIVSAFGVWIAWKSSSEDKPTRIVEQRQSIPLTLRGVVENDGESLEISPVEQTHALQSLTVTIKDSSPIVVGSDGRLSAGDAEAALKDRDKDRKGAHAVPVRIDVRYVEMGTDRRSGANYVLRYRWEGGGLFGGRSLRLTGLSRG